MPRPAMPGIAALFCALCCALCCACAPEAPEDVEPPPTIPTVPDFTDDPIPGTGDTGGLVPEELKYARELRIIAFVGWNAETQRVQSVNIDGDWYLSTFSMRLSVEDGASSDDVDDRCSVTVGLTDYPAVPPGSADERFRLEIPAGLENPGTPGEPEEVFADCDERRFTGTQVPEGYTPHDWWASLPWELALVDGELDPDLAERLAAQDRDPAEHAQGRQSGAFEAPTLGHLSFWLAYEMDVTGIVPMNSDGDGGVAMTRGQMLSGEPGNPPTGYYVFDQLLHWDLPDQLTFEP